MIWGRIVGMSEDVEWNELVKVLRDHGKQSDFYSEEQADALLAAGYRRTGTPAGLRNQAQPLQDRQVIPEAAVEAAAIELWDGADPDIPWERISEYVKERTRERTRKALEAAAPHLIQAAKAEAWDEAIEAYKAWTWDEENIEPLSNPYRTTK